MYRKIFHGLLFILMSGFLVTSCGVNYSLEKRHYSKGYYFSGGREKFHATGADENSQELDTEPKRTETKLAFISNEENYPIETVVTMNTPIKTADSVVGVEEKESVPGFIVKNNGHKDSNSQIRYKNLKGEISRSNPFKDTSEGLSLFWIVILVILILWAIGFIGGNIGAVINLLLLVALILLILWLLRVI